MTAQRDIVCLSKHPWNGPRFRKQHFMSYLASQGHRVLYVQPSRSLLRRSGSVDDPQPGVFRGRSADAGGGIRVLTPSFLLPKPGARPSQFLNHLKMTLETRRACRSAGFSRPVVWVYDPHYAPFIGVLGPSGVVFDLVDDLQGYPGSSGSLRVTGRHIRLLCDHADRVLLTSEVLAREYSPKAPYRVVANGFDDALFRPVSGAPGSATTGRPRAGFVGALFDFLDYQLLVQTARRLPEVDFVLAGRRYTDDAALDGLLGLPNVTYLGYVSPERIPALVRTFDVCLCPFKVDRVSRAVSPLKVYEYLAVHKPVVATPMEGIRRDPIGRFIDFAAGGDEYAELVRLRATQGRVFDSGLDAVLEASTWERRCREVAAFVRDVVTDADPTCA